MIKNYGVTTVFLNIIFVTWARHHVISMTPRLVLISMMHLGLQFPGLKSLTLPECMTIHSELSWGFHWMVINHPKAESFLAHINNKLPPTLGFYLTYDISPLTWANITGRKYWWRNNKLFFPMQIRPIEIDGI